ncbi:TPA: hypothetical protein ACGR6T_004734 [Klebsiella aerogenes]
MSNINKVVIDESTVKALFEIELDNLIKLTKDDLVWNINENFLKYFSEYSDEDAEKIVGRIIEKKELEFETFHNESSVGRSLLRMLPNEDNSFDINKSSYPTINFKLSEIMKRDIKKPEYESHKGIFSEITKEDFHNEREFYSTLFENCNSENDGFIYYARDTNIYMLNHKRIFELNKENIYRVCNKIKEEKREAFENAVLEAKKELNISIFKKDIAEAERKEINIFLKNECVENESLNKRKRRI